MFLFRIDYIVDNYPNTYDTYANTKEDALAKFNQLNIENIQWLDCYKVYA